MKGTENTRVDTLSRKPGYKDKQKTRDLSFSGKIETTLS
jgi:hypothetical protein